MKICPKCGFRETVPWRGSRFDFNAEYIRFDEAVRYLTLKEIWQKLKDKGNFQRIIVGPYSFYRRGTGGIYLYRVPNEDFKVPRERKSHAHNRS